MDWLLLVYKLPADPSRLRAGIWRKLKAAGAVYLQEGVATLPADPAAEALLQTLVADIRRMQGTAYLLSSTPLSDEASLLATFNAARATEYAELLGRCRDFHAELAKERAVHNLTFAELEENEEDLAKLSAWLRKVQARDRFGVPEQGQAEQALAACREDLERFADEVHAAEDPGASHV